MNICTSSSRSPVTIIQVAYRELQNFTMLTHSPMSTLVLSFCHRQKLFQFEQKSENSLSSLRSVIISWKYKAGEGLPFTVRFKITNIFGADYAWSNCTPVGPFKAEIIICPSFIAFFNSLIFFLLSYRWHIHFIIVTQKGDTFNERTC